MTFLSDARSAEIFGREAGETIRAVTAPLAEHIKELEACVVALEARRDDELKEFIAAATRRLENRR